MALINFGHFEFNISVENWPNELKPKSCYLCVFNVYFSVIDIYRCEVGQSFRVLLLHIFYRAAQ